MAEALCAQFFALGLLGLLFGKFGVFGDVDDADTAVGGRFVSFRGGGEGFLEADEGVVVLVGGGKDGEGGGYVVGDAHDGGELVGSD